MIPNRFTFSLSIHITADVDRPTQQVSHGKRRRVGEKVQIHKCCRWGIVAIHIWFFNSDTQSILVRSFAFIFVSFVGVRYDLVFSYFVLAFFVRRKSAGQRWHVGRMNGTKTKKNVGEE